MLSSPPRPTPSAANRPLSAQHRSRWTGDLIRAIANVAAALLFVVGCLGFYAESLYNSAITAFLAGSVLFLVSAIGAAVALRDGMRRADRHGSSDPTTNTPGASS